MHARISQGLCRGDCRREFTSGSSRSRIFSRNFAQDSLSGILVRDFIGAICRVSPEFLPELPCRFLFGVSVRLIAEVYRRKVTRKPAREPARKSQPMELPEEPPRSHSGGHSDSYLKSRSGSSRMLLRPGCKKGQILQGICPFLMQAGLAVDYFSSIVL